MKRYDSPLVSHFSVTAAPCAVDVALSVLQAHPLGRNAARIGTVTADHPRILVARTAMGANRVISIPVGEQLPRIC